MTLVQPQWFAIQVRPRYERFVATSLKGKDIEEFLPLYKVRRRWSDRLKELEKPLFHGYVFCRINPVYRLPVLTIPGVIQFVGIDKEPIPITGSEIEGLRAIVRSGLPALPWPFLRVGQKIRIEEGPLRDVEGILANVKGLHRLVVSVALLQRSVAVEIDREWAAPVNPTRAELVAEQKRPHCRH
jgi:transcription antitermination factor NusG